MENTALNGTTATKDQEDWKKKKGSGRIVAASLALLLGLSFYAGRQASSSSVSLVGSGTAASNLKTLTLALDDDEVIERGIFFEMPWLGSGGGNAGDKSDLKTLTLIFDDDRAVQEFSEWLRKKKPNQRSYAIGVPYPLAASDSKILTCYDEEKPKTRYAIGVPWPL